MDDYLDLINAMTKAAARRGFQLHRYRTISTKPSDDSKIQIRYALHPLGFPRPYGYKNCEGGLVLEIKGVEGVSHYCHAYAPVYEAYKALAAHPITHHDKAPDYLYKRDHQGDPIYPHPVPDQAPPRNPRTLKKLGLR